MEVSYSRYLLCHLAYDKGFTGHGQLNLCWRQTSPGLPALPDHFYLMRRSSSSDSTLWMPVQHYGWTLQNTFLPAQNKQCFVKHKIMNIFLNENNIMLSWYSLGLQFHSRSHFQIQENPSQVTTFWWRRGLLRQVLVIQKGLYCIFGYQTKPALKINIKDHVSWETTFLTSMFWSPRVGS